MPTDPQQTKIALTAKQLASLDLLIAKKSEKKLTEGDGEDYTNDVADNLGNVAGNLTAGAIGLGAAGATPAAGIVATAGAVADATAVAARYYAGGDAAAHEKAIRAAFNEAARRMPLDQLIELRNMAIKKEE